MISKRTEGPVLIVRPRAAVRLGILAVTIALVVAAVLLSYLFVVGLVLALPALLWSRGRIELGPDSYQVRTWRGGSAPEPYDRVQSLRLRHDPLLGLGVLRRGFRVGSASTAPLRLVIGDIRRPVRVFVSLREGWEEAARFLSTIAWIDEDDRTRDRVASMAAAVPTHAAHEDTESGDTLRGDQELTVRGAPRDAAASPGEGDRWTSDASMLFLHLHPVPTDEATGTDGPQSPDGFRAVARP